MCSAPTIPRAVSAATTTSDSISLVWEAPIQLNGDIKTIEVNYSYYQDELKETKVMSKIFPFNNTRKYTISNLYPYVTYTIQVREKTVEFGPAAVVNLTTLASGKKI